MNKQPKPSARVRRASETNEAVERIIAATQNAAVDLGAIPQALDNVRRLRTGQPAQWSRNLIAQKGAENVLAINDFVARNAIVELWRQQGRIAYDLNPELAAQLHRSDLKGKLPGGLFDRLPHISPLIPLPRPWPFRSTRNGLIRGFFVTGRIGREAFCPTTDPNSVGLGIMPWVEWEGAQLGQYLEVATPLFVIPRTDGPFTVDDIIDHTNTWHGTESDGTEKKVTRQILPGALSLLMYLCCDNRDVQEPVQQAPSKGKRKQAPPRDPFYVRVGWHIGPKLHSGMIRAKARAEHGGVAVPSGAEYGPQHRVGHYKLVHHGPQKSLSSLRWIEPYWTKLDELEQMRAEGREPGTGIIPVDQQQRDPSGHRDVKLANLGTAKAKEIRQREAQQAREDSMEW
jgi:hypothetical protein